MSIYVYAAIMRNVIGMMDFPHTCHCTLWVLRIVLAPLGRTHHVLAALVEKILRVRWRERKATTACRLDRCEDITSFIMVLNAVAILGMMEPFPRRNCGLFHHHRYAAVTCSTISSTMIRLGQSTGARGCNHQHQWDFYPFQKGRHHLTTMDTAAIRGYCL